MTQKSYNYIFGFLAAVIAFSVYLATLAPTVWFIDSGELAAVASTLGVAHPTGYPLFTIIGHVFTLLPFSNSEVYKLNVMSAFFCSAGIFMFFLLMKYLISNYSVTHVQDRVKKPVKSTPQKNPAKEKHIDIPSAVGCGAAGLASLILAFSKTYWGQANSVEVYPIHVFFLITLIFVFFKAVFNTKIAASSTAGSSFISQNKYYLIFAFMLGLSFTNHLTTILLAPACLTIFFYYNVHDKQRLWKLLGLMAACFIVGFSVYLYLPIKANMNPTFFWGNPHNFERFYWHITGKQFSVWIFSAQGSIAAFMFLIAVTIGLCVYGLVKQKTLNRNVHFLFFVVISIAGYFVISGSNKIVLEQFQKFSGSLWGEFGTALVLVSILGVYFLSKYNLTIYYFTLLTFFGCLFYSINYDINDIYSYFLLSYITIALWIGFGALFIYTQAAEMLKTTAQKIAFSVIIVLLSLITLNTNYAGNDESKNYYVEEFTMNVFNNAEPNSVIISSQWDFWVSASWYFNFVKKIRPDLVIIDKELLRRSWYLAYIERNYPEIYNNSRAEIERFIPELYKFEHSLPYDQKTIVKTFEDMVTSFVKNNPGRKIYTTWEIEQNKNEPFAQDFVRVPEGMLFRLVHKDLVKDNTIPEYKVYDFKFTPVTKTDYYHETLMLSYAMMLTASANYLVTLNRPEDAKKYLALALLAKPNHPQAIEMKRKFNL
jgi:hypothetical protein